MKVKSLILLILGSFPMISCLSHKHKNDDRICTTEYRMLTVSIKDSLSQPVMLDDYFVKKVLTGEIIDFAKEDPFMDSIFRTQGIYLICTDGKMSMTSQQGTEFEFHGYLGSTEVVNEPYIIRNDECHVIMIAGKQEVFITE